jgi:hypothetical protein
LSGIINSNKLDLEPVLLSELYMINKKHMQLSVIQRRIYQIRGQNVILDFDVASLYNVDTKVLKQAVKRNAARFPSDFMFEISRSEFKSLRSQIVISKRGGTRYLPYAFTEQGVAMLSGVLKSKKAIDVNISIMRAFVLIRQYALSHKELTEKLNKIESTYNNKFKDIFKAINFLLTKEM